MPATTAFPLTKENQSFDVAGVPFFSAKSGMSGIIYITADVAVVVRQTRDGWGWARDGAVNCVESGFASAQDAAAGAFNPSA